MHEASVITWSQSLAGKGSGFMELSRYMACVVHVLCVSAHGETVAIIIVIIAELDWI